MKNVALFVGNDIFSWLVSDLIATLKGECAFTVYFPCEKRLAHAGWRFAAWARRAKALNDFVFPFVGRNAKPPARGLSAGPVPAAAGVAHRVLDINDAAFISSLGMDGGDLLRCYQKFSADYVRAPSRRGKLLWNLHPGDLSRVIAGDGRCSARWMNGDRDRAVTLHEWMSTGTPARLSPACLPSCASRFVVPGKHDAVGRAEWLFLARRLMLAEHSEAIAAEKQGDSRYWGFPDAQTLAQAEQAGIELVDHDAVREQYLGLFVGDRFHPLAGQFCAGFDDFVRAHGHD
ncbi:hypothetical protein M8494_28575 [Serratia ureilytica]